MMKPRKQAKQSAVRSTSIFYHPLSKTSILDSDLEHDYLILKIFQQKSEYLKTQPEPLFLNVNGKIRRYTPDLESIESGDGFIDEVKHSTKAMSPENIDKFSIITAACAEQAKTFRVMTEKEIYNGERHKNLRYLAPVLKHPSPIEEVQILIASLDCKSMHIKELMQHIKNMGMKPCLIRRALAHKLLICDLTKKYSDLIISWA